MADRNLTLVLKARDEAQATLDRIDKTLGKIEGSHNRVIASFKRGVIYTLGFETARRAMDMLHGAVVGTMEAAGESERVQGQLNATLASTGGIAGVTAAAANDLADSLSKIAPFEDEAILGAENLLLTFTRVGQNVFPQATQAILDMSTAMGQDLSQTAVQVGKAMQDPILGVTALRRVGVQLSEAQQRLVKDFMATGEIEKAQTVILKELQTEFGGSAKAAGETLPGKLAIMRTAFGNIQEQIGGVLIPIFSGLATSATKWANDALPVVANFLRVMGALAEQVSQNEPVMKALAITVGVVLTAALWGAAAAFWGMIAPALPVVAAFAAVATAVAVVIDHWSLFEQAATIIQTVIGNIANTVGSVLRPAFQAMGDIVGKVTGFIADRFRTLAQVAVIMGLQAGQSVDQLRGLIDFTNNIGTGGVDLSGINTAFQGMAAGVGNTIGDLVSRAKGGLESIGAFKDQLIAELQRPFERLPGGMGGGPARVLPEGEGDGGAGAKTKTALEEILSVMERLNRENAFRVWREEMKALLASGDITGVIAQFEAIGRTSKESADEILKMMDELDDAAKRMADAAVEEASRIVQGQADAIKEALADGRTLQDGLAEFAEAEWIAQMEANIKKALAAGLTPDPSLISAFQSAMNNTIDIQQKRHEEMLDAQSNLDQAYIAQKKKDLEFQGQQEYAAAQAALQRIATAQRDTAEGMARVAQLAADTIKGITDEIGNLATTASRRFEELAIIARFRGEAFDPRAGAQEAFRFATSRIRTTPAGFSPGDIMGVEEQRALFFGRQKMPDIVMKVGETEFGRVAGWSTQGLSVLLARFGA